MLKYLNTFAVYILHFIGLGTIDQTSFKYRHFISTDMPHQLNISHENQK